MELLMYNEEEQRVEPTPEARQIDAFKKIIIADKGSKGDSDGRKKYLATKQLTYIYLIEHPMSMFMDFAPNERHEKICEFLDLGIKPDDKLITNGRKVYSELVSTATSRTIESIRDGLFSTISLISRTTQIVQKLLDEISKADINDKEERTQAIDQLNVANGLLDSMLDKSAKVPKTIEILNEMSEKMKKQMSTKRQIRGTGEINPFEE